MSPEFPCNGRACSPLYLPWVGPLLGIMPRMPHVPIGFLSPYNCFRIGTMTIY